MDDGFVVLDTICNYETLPTATHNHKAPQKFCAKLLGCYSFLRERDFGEGLLVTYNNAEFALLGCALRELQGDFHAVFGKNRVGKDAFGFLQERVF